MPVGAGSIKRAAKTAETVNAEAVKKESAKPETPAEKPTAKKTVKAAAKKTGANTNAKATVKASVKAAVSTEVMEMAAGEAAQKTYGINDELPVYLL